MKVPSIDIAKRWEEIFKKDLPDIIRRTEEVQNICGDYEGFTWSITAEREITECHYCYIYGNFLASSVMLCTALETVFKKIIPTRESLRLLANNLLEYQVITNGDYAMIDDLINYRNKIVHAKIPSTMVLLEVPEVVNPDYDSMWQECSKHLKLSNLFYKIQRNPLYYGELSTRFGST